MLGIGVPLHSRSVRKRVTSPLCGYTHGIDTCACLSSPLACTPPPPSQLQLVMAASDDNSRLPKNGNISDNFENTEDDGSTSFMTKGQVVSTNFSGADCLSWFLICLSAFSFRFPRWLSYCPIKTPFTGVLW